MISNVRPAARKRVGMAPTAINATAYSISEQEDGKEIEGGGEREEG